jgi:hypothetical protein
VVKGGYAGASKTMANNKRVKDAPSDATALMDETNHQNDRSREAESTNRAASSGVPQQSVSSADVERRAYQIYCERGREHGHDVEDWLQAERELRPKSEAEPLPQAERELLPPLGY